MNMALFSDEFVLATWPTLPDVARGRIERYGADLLRYNRAQNLVSRRDSERRIAALVEECVRAGVVLDSRGVVGGRWADVGSGAGIPGLLLGILHPERPITLIERRQGRCDFLRREIRVLELGAVEEFQGDASAWPGSRFDAVFAKAVANPLEIEALCDRLVGGRLLVFGRPEDPVAEGWALEWAEPLGSESIVLRSLTRR